MPKAIGYAATAADSGMSAFHFERRALRPDDVRIDILFCGVCHSDLHTARNDWGGTIYPCCPGHEIVGRVSAVGPQVLAVRLGDRDELLAPAARHAARRRPQVEVLTAAVLAVAVAAARHDARRAFGSSRRRGRPAPSNLAGGSPWS